MPFLLLTILSSVLVSTILKINEGRGGHRLVVAGVNYVMAAVLALSVGGASPASLETTWALVAVAAGFGFIGGFWMLMVALKEIGLAIPTSAARLSMLLPVTGSILFLGERPAPMQIVGIGAGVAAFVLLGLAQRTSGAASRLDLRAIGILISIFLIVGTTDFTMKLSQANGVDEDAMAFVIFASAALCCLIPVAVRRVRATRHDIGLGLLLGIPNYCSVYFLLLALQDIDASLAFPVVSSGAVVAVTAVAVIFWRERPNRLAWFGIALAAVAVALLGLSGGGQ